MRSILLCALSVTGCCFGPASGGAVTPETLRPGEPRRVEVGTAYRVEGTDVVLTPRAFTPLDTQAGHVLTAEVLAEAGGAAETLRLHARPGDTGVELDWRGVGIELREEGFTYGGSTATLIATLAPQALPTCVPPGLEHATVIQPIALPDGCRWQGGGPPSAPRIAGTAEELAAALVCDAGATPPAIDLPAVRVVIVEESLSPASSGSEIRDEGHAIVFVDRQRSPCPDDPLPMPMQRSFGFTLARAMGERAYRTAVCTIPPHCP